MNFIKKLIDKLIPVPNGKVEAPQAPPVPEKVELQFRVVTHYEGSDYYVLQYKGKWGWERVTVLYESYRSENDSLDHPVLSKDFEELVEMGKKFKNDPASFRAFQQRQIDRYNQRKAARAEEVKKHDSRTEYI